MRKPGIPYSCSGSYDSDAEDNPYDKTRPFKHSRIGRRNWRRVFAKRRRADDRLEVSSGIPPAQ